MSNNQEDKDLKKLSTRMGGDDVPLDRLGGVIDKGDIIAYISGRTFKIAMVLDIRKHTTTWMPSDKFVWQLRVRSVIDYWKGKPLKLGRRGGYWIENPQIKAIILAEEMIPSDYKHILNQITVP